MRKWKLSECTSHLVEYAANRGFSRIRRMTRILGFGFIVGFCEADVGGILRVSGANWKVCGTNIISGRGWDITGLESLRYKHQRSADVGGILRVSNWKVCGTNISGRSVGITRSAKSQGSRVELAPTSTSPYIFIVKTTETRDVCVSQRFPFGCMLFNNFNIYCLKNV